MAKPTEKQLRRMEQLAIPGLEGPEKAADNARQKRKTLQEQIKALQDRVLRLELEISLLRILVEKGGDKDNVG